MWDIDSLSVAMLTRFLSYGVIARLQSLDCLGGGSILTVVGVSLEGSGGRGAFACTAHAEEGRDRVGSCNLQLHCQSVCDWPGYWSVQSVRTAVLAPNCVCVRSPLSAMDCSCGVGGNNETESSHCAIYNCTLRALGTVPTSGLFNPQ